MKRYAYLLAAAALALNISCTGPENPAQPEATLKAEPASLRFAAAAAPAQTVTVTAEETEWTHSIPEDAGWLTATRDGDRLSVSVADNADETDRSASITLNASAEGVEPVKITVRQEAAEAPEPEKAFALGIAREARLRRCGGIGTGGDGNRDGRYHLESIPFGCRGVDTHRPRRREIHRHGGRQPERTGTESIH